ncbi:MAG TPA: PIN domain-containing protein [Spirochaetota bacterium]|nr:PIN domain-containing protein [Spirochaetota bacterium]
MKEKIFIDSDVILDVILERQPHFENSQRILAYIENNIFNGYTSSLILSNCFYIINNKKNKDAALKAIRKLRSILTILSFTDKEIGESINSSFTDFEDGIQYFICINNDLPTLITRNIKDFKKSNINIFTPKEYLNLEDIKNTIEAK